MTRLYVYLFLLTLSVFMGTEFLAISTPLAQITLYRLLALGVIPMLVYQLSRSNSRLVIQPNSMATLAIKCYVAWWIIAGSSIMWAANLRAWLQTIFLMTLGVSSILGLYFGIQSIRHWQRLIQTAWAMMSGLVLWGYIEITTNIYLLGNLAKLDKYNTFSSQPLTRIPVTIFENQNDYATMLLAYVVVCLILYYLTANNWLKMFYLISLLAGSYLIYRSGSRMSLLCLLLFFIVQMVQGIKIDLRRQHYWWGFVTIIIALLGVFVLRPSLLQTFTELFYFGEQRSLSGDTVRVNLWRNGFLFLGQTFGLGVGAGNIEHWMGEYAFWTTNSLTNMHNWWLEILVGYGIISFTLYLIAYIGLMTKLYQLKRYSKGPLGFVAFTLFNFMLTYVLASVTSANNMLIEWHWVFFGLIISFVKIKEKAFIYPTILKTPHLKEKV